jgi:hypothetical protein
MSGRVEWIRLVLTRIRIANYERKLRSRELAYRNGQEYLERVRAGITQQPH